MPADYITWFQATIACQASGKRLPKGSEWLRAALGTSDTAAGGNDGTVNNVCNTKASDIRKTGNGLGPTAITSCVSFWGAEDMIGNLTELDDDWYTGLGDNTSAAVTPWPDDSYGNDGTINIASSAWTNGKSTPGIPAAGHRGGDFGAGGLAGVYAFFGDIAPSAWSGSWGFRCVLSR
jgi:formylglycine-generating enzyme required for sulfatase activity